MKAYERLNNPKSWTTRTGARNMAGMAVPYTSEEAISFCLSSMVKLCYGPKMVEQIFIKMSYEIGTHNIEEWNDRTTTKHPDVLKLLKKLNV